MYTDLFHRPVCSHLTGIHPLYPASFTSLTLQKFYVLPTQCIYVFCADLRTNSHYFPIQH